MGPRPNHIPQFADVPQIGPRSLETKLDESAKSCYDQSLKVGGGFRKPVYRRLPAGKEALLDQYALLREKVLKTAQDVLRLQSQHLKSLSVQTCFKTWSQTLEGSKKKKSSESQLKTVSQQMDKYSTQSFLKMKRMIGQSDLVIIFRSWSKTVSQAKRRFEQAQSKEESKTKLMNVAEHVIAKTQRRNLLVSSFRSWSCTMLQQASSVPQDDAQFDELQSSCAASPEASPKTASSMPLRLPLTPSLPPAPKVEVGECSPCYSASSSTYSKQSLASRSPVNKLPSPPVLAETVSPVQRRRLFDAPDAQAARSLPSCPEMDTVVDTPSGKVRRSSRRHRSTSLRSHAKVTNMVSKLLKEQLALKATSAELCTQETSRPTVEQHPSSCSSPSNRCSPQRMGSDSFEAKKYPSLLQQMTPKDGNTPVIFASESDSLLLEINRNAFFEKQVDKEREEEKLLAEKRLLAEAAKLKEEEQKAELEAREERARREKVELHKQRLQVQAEKELAEEKYEEERAEREKVALQRERILERAYRLKWLPKYMRAWSDAVKEERERAEMECIAEQNRREKVRKAAEARVIARSSAVSQGAPSFSSHPRSFTFELSNPEEPPPFSSQPTSNTSDQPEPTQPDQATCQQPDTVPTASPHHSPTQLPVIPTSLPPPPPPPPPPELLATSAPQIAASAAAVVEQPTAVEAPAVKTAAVEPSKHDHDPWKTLFSDDVEEDQEQEAFYLGEASPHRRARPRRSLSLLGKSRR